MNERPEPGRDLDTSLADFTDRLLQDKAADLAPEADKDLRSLQESVLRLQRAFQPDLPDEKTRQRLLSDFRRRARREQASAARPGWWSRQSRQRLLVACAAVLVLVILVGAPIFLPGVNGSLQGTATSTRQNIALLIVFTGVLAFLMWQGRRK
jgi:hypothetical protein